jgi:DNA helicase-2/ATP-dependent DNA helicase PcrA
MLKTTKPVNPAEEAAQKALDKAYACIRKHQSFRLEAGAGAGKTYSLIKALRYIIDAQSRDLLKRGQQVACISYTNVATDEITARTDNHPAVHSSTIHAFCWSLIKGFQPFLRKNLSDISGWPEKLNEVGGIGQMRVDYELGHRRINSDAATVSLGHNDVLSLTVFLMANQKFRNLFTSRYPILFIDEYQDTNKAFAESILEHFINTDKGPLIGLFGDSWQKIYGDGCGLIEHDNLTFIGKEANFRSVKTIVDILNRMRPDLPQEVKDPYSTGSVAVYHSNAWVGTRRAGSQWNGDLPANDAHNYLESVRHLLEDEGWDFSPEKTKILMLTHNVLAAEQKYSGIARAFRYKESYIKKEDPHISFLVDTLEPICIAYQMSRYGDMFVVPGAGSLTINTFDDKREWASEMNKLLDLRESGTIGQVMDYLKGVKRPWIPDVVRQTESELISSSPEEIAVSQTLTQISKLRDVSYQELIALAQFINEHTPFSTKHGVKGAEFENVLVVLGRGWNLYNWNRFLELSQSEIPNNELNFYERNRNLFYVCCSRPKERLALLFTQKLSGKALLTLANWFGEENIHSVKI